MEQKTVQWAYDCVQKKKLKNTPIFFLFFSKKISHSRGAEKMSCPTKKIISTVIERFAKGRSCESFFLISGKGSTFAMSRTLKRGNRERRRTVEARERSKGGKSRDFFFPCCEERNIKRDRRKDISGHALSRVVNPVQDFSPILSPSLSPPFPASPHPSPNSSVRDGEEGKEFSLQKRYSSYFEDHQRKINSSSLSLSLSLFLSLYLIFQSLHFSFFSQSILFFSLPAFLGFVSFTVLSVLLNSLLSFLWFL